MRKEIVRGILTAIFGISLIAGNVQATSLSYWHIVSTDAEFHMGRSNANFELGIFKVPDISNPDVNSIHLTTIFSRGPASSGSKQLLAADYDVFGFYVKNVKRNRIWLSDESISGPADGGELDGLSIRNDTDRFMIDHLFTDDGVLVENSWLFSFAMPDGMELSWTMVGKDIAPVPEPATMLLFGAGLVGLAGVIRKKKFKN